MNETNPEDIIKHYIYMCLYIWKNMLNSIFSVITYNYRDKLEIKISEFCQEISITLHHFIWCIFFFITLFPQKGFNLKSLHIKVLQKSLVKLHLRKLLLGLLFNSLCFPSHPGILSVFRAVHISHESCQCSPSLRSIFFYTNF